MKKLLYFLPSILVLVFLSFILLAMPDPSADPQEYITGVGILLVFLFSDFLLFSQKSKKASPFGDAFLTDFDQAAVLNSVPSPMIWATAWEMVSISLQIRKTTRSPLTRTL